MNYDDYKDFNLDLSYKFVNIDNNNDNNYDTLIDYGFNNNFIMNGGKSKKIRYDQLPTLEDPYFYDLINKTFNTYKIKEDKVKDISKFCGRRTFKLQKPQEFVSEYINPKTDYKSLLVYHRIGAGKTCSAITVAEKWKKERKIIFVLPASLIGNFRNELRGLCAGEEYISKKSRKKLTKLSPNSEEYKKIIRESNKKIDKYYKIYSYNKFITLAKEDEISLRNTLLIIDEIQNMVSVSGTYYSTLYNLIHSSPDSLRILLLSATPMFDKPVEFALTFNLLKPRVEMETGKEFMDTYIKSYVRNGKNYYTTQNLEEFKTLIKGYVSYYKGAPSYTFPKMTVRYVECEMSSFQYGIYRKILKSEQSKSKVVIREIDDSCDEMEYCTADCDYNDEDKIMNAIDLPNHFFIGTRYVSNIVFPNKRIDDGGLRSLSKKKILNDLDKYSCKFDKMMKSINRTSGKVFIYSGFKGNAGINCIAKILRAYGYKDFDQHGEGKKRYAIWSGDVKLNKRENVRNVYNKRNNDNGSKLRIIIGSPSIKEGVSLKSVRYVHVIEPYWNNSRLEQVFGRASRFCSHIFLDESKRNVKVYVYIAKKNRNQSKSCSLSIDQYIKKLADKKMKLVSKFEKAVREAAIDCKLNENANDNDTDNIKCSY